MSEPELIVLGRRRGRPRSDEPLSAVLTRLPVSHHDQLCRIARQRGVSVSSVVRAIVIKSIDQSNNRNQ